MLTPVFVFGGVCSQQAYHLLLPDTLTGSNISFLELLNIFVALQYWAHRIKESSVPIYCDNMAAVHTLNSFKAVCPQLCCVWSLIVRFNISLTVKHIAGKCNHVADKLYRLSSDADIAHFHSTFPEYETKILFSHWCHLNTNI